MLYTPAFFALFAANLAVVASFTCYFLFPLFITEYGGTPGDIGLLMGLFAFASAACRPWISPWIDRLGRKRCYALGCIVMIAIPFCYPLFASAPLSIAPLSLIRLMHGIGMALCFTSAFTFIADIVPPARLNEGIGLFGISGLVGIALGPALGEMALSLAGFKGLFILSSSLALMALFSLLPVPDPTPSETDQPTRTPFFTLLRQPRHAQVAILAALFGFGVSTSGNFIAPLCEQRGISSVTPFFVSYSIAAVACRLFVGRVADAVGEIKVLPWAYFVCALGLLLVLPAKGSWLLGISGFICGGGHGLLFPTLNTLAIRDIPYHSRGAVTGIFTGSIDSGIFIGSMILGGVANYIPLAWIFFISSLVFVFGLFILIHKEQRKRGRTIRPL